MNFLLLKTSDFISREIASRTTNRALQSNDSSVCTKTRTLWCMNGMLWLIEREDMKTRPFRNTEHFAQTLPMMEILHCRLLLLIN